MSQFRKIDKTIIREVGIISKNGVPNAEVTNHLEIKQENKQRGFSSKNCFNLKFPLVLVKLF